MEVIMEFFFELIVEGCLEASFEKKVPLPVRIIAAIVLIVIFGGLIGICFYSAVHHQDLAMLILGIVILVITISGIRAVYRKHRQ